MTEPREYTTEEVREMFLNHVCELIQYWETVIPSDGRIETIKDRLEGLAHSLLVTLDGGSLALPGFVIAPLGDPSDKQYHIDNEENWFPCNSEVELSGEIGGGLHELLFWKTVDGKRVRR